MDTAQAVRSVDGSKTWLDPIVGLQLHTPENSGRWPAQVYTEIGSPVVHF